jgi:ankyrin repeat protein
MVAGSGKSVIWSVVPRLLHIATYLFFVSSSVIQDVMAACESGSAIMAYFYFDFRNLSKQTCHDLLRSLVFQFSTDSGLCCDILHGLYNAHKDGTQQPSDDTLKECLKEMLGLVAQGPTFIVLDALDECPDSSAFPSPRDEVLQLVEELVNLHLSELHICATSRPEVDIRAVLEPLVFRSVSLHDENGQKADIADYIWNVVHSSCNSSTSAAMRRWRAEDKNLVIETLTKRADGMLGRRSILSCRQFLTSLFRFRWVFCQLDALRHCFPPNLRQFLNELPETLDETYERILRNINKAQKEDARRLLQCLAAAVRPLRVEELAELLAFDFQGMCSGGIPKLREDWRWDNQEEAVLSTCSSLITIIPRDDSRVVQFSHFSVKEYLTSPRLARSPHGDVSRFRIDLEPAHTVMAQACLATLLQQAGNAGNSYAELSPLVKYAAQHWADHAQFENVSSRIREGMDDLFDSSKPHFAAWVRVHDIDERWSTFDPGLREVTSPLYYAAFCGFYDMAERLIMKHPDQVNARSGRILSPLLAALYKRHFRVANLLHTHGAVVDVQDHFERTPLYVASFEGQVDIMRWLLDHGADADAKDIFGITPLFNATNKMHLDAVQVLLEHNADLNRQLVSRMTALNWVLSYCHMEGQVVDIVRRLLEHGADPNICDENERAPLHQASYRGWLEAIQLLLSYGANVDEQDEEGMTPLRIATSEGHDKITKLLLNHGAVPQP